MNNRVAVGALLLAVIVPVGLIVFKFSGFGGGPATIAETVTSEPAKWEFEMPSGYIDFSDIQVERIYSSDIWLNQILTVTRYVPVGNYGDPDLPLEVNLTAFLEGGYIENVNLTCHDDYLLSLVYWSNHLRIENLTSKGYNEGLRGTTEKAFYEFEGLNRPSSVYLYARLAWVLPSPHNQAQSLIVNVAVIYFNGTVHKRVVQPFEIKLVADDDNSFDTATEIEGNKTLTAFLGGNDRQDFFRIFAEKGDEVNITMVPPINANFDIYLYDAGEICVANSKNRSDVVDSMDHLFNGSGWWFIAIEFADGGDGIYTLDYTLLTNGG